MTDYSAMFQEVKHSGYKLTTAEQAALREYLLKGDRTETDAALYVFCLSNDVTLENIEVVERFLDDDTDDYTRRSALICLITIWDVHDQKYVDYIIMMLDKIGDLEFDETVRAAFRAAFHIIAEHGDSRLLDAVDNKIDEVHDKLHLCYPLMDTLFKSACFLLMDHYTVARGMGRTYISTLEEAEEIYKEKEKYLSIWR